MTTPATSAGADIVVGVFVGGRGSRLGGVAKGLLQAPDNASSLVERLLIELGAALPAAELVLVGNAAAYQSLGLRAVADAPGAEGPLGGLLGLLQYAESAQRTHVLALACDLPYIERNLLQRLGSEENDAAALVSKTGTLRNPLVARYRVLPALAAARDVLASGARSLQAVLDRLGDGAVVLSLSSAEEASLRDWDTPEDMQRR